MRGARSPPSRPPRDVPAGTHDRAWRTAAVALALGSAAIHLVLSVANLIPGEPTVGPQFAAFGIGYVGVAVLILRRTLLFDQLSALYTFAIFLAYVASRVPIDAPLPVEPIGVGTVVDEAALLFLLVRLIRGGRGKAGGPPEA